jgi:2-dehydro-3-deoxyphosphogluconate aldolase/(4S)-4-hydroxy-2-oxoglutarate aldolase
MMKLKEDILNSLLEKGILPLFFYHGVEESIAVMQTLYKAGIRTLEYTNRGENAYGNFKILKRIQTMEMPDLYLGIGTIKSLMEAREFIAIGADFLVSPIINTEVANLCNEHNILWIPGCMTPTEIYTAQCFKAPLVKLFPANVLGPGFLSAIKELFPGLLFIPTGGVELEQQNINGWFHAGVSAIGLGSKLINKQVLEERRYDELFKNTRLALEMVQYAKASFPGK